MKTSVIITTRNNPEYLNLCIDSLIKHSVLCDDFVIADDSTNDQTEQWFANKMLPTSWTFHYFRVKSGGMAEGNNRAFQLIKYPMAFMAHDDMVFGPQWDQKLLCYWQGPYTVASAILVEPGIMPVCPYYIHQDFGQDIQGFNMDNFEQFVRNNNNMMVEENVLGHYVISRQFFEELGGIDEIFRTSQRNDTDLNYRIVLSKKAYCYRPRNALIYHFAGKGGATEKGLFSDEWRTKEEQAIRNIIRKWGYFDVGLPFGECKPKIKRLRNHREFAVVYIDVEQNGQVPPWLYENEVFMDAFYFVGNNPPDLHLGIPYYKVKLNERLSRLEAWNLCQPKVRYPWCLVLDHTQKPDQKFFNEMHGLIQHHNASAISFIPYIVQEDQLKPAYNIDFLLFKTMAGQTIYHSGIPILKEF